MKKITILLTLVLSIFALSGCSSNDKKTADTSANSASAVLKIGVTAGPHAEIMDNVKTLAAKQGLKLEIVEFSDYVSPNVALFQGEIFANSMQHDPYLQATLKKEPKFDLKECFKTVNFPQAVYSKKIKKGQPIPNDAIIAIPNDPSNGGRALLLLANAGLIKVKDINNVISSVADITENKHNFKFQELDAATIPRSMEDVTVAVINANYALPAGLNPSKDSILLESAKNPFVNIFVTKAGNVNSKEIAKLKSIYQSPENEKFIIDYFKGTILPAWK